MDSIDRVFKLVNEGARMGKRMGKRPAEERPAEERPILKRDTYGGDRATKELMRTKSPTAAQKAAATRSQIAIAQGQAKAQAARRAKVNASTEIANILNLLKEAYQDELISEEAFLAIADPIMRSLIEKKK